MSLTLGEGLCSQMKKTIGIKAGLAAIVAGVLHYYQANKATWAARKTFTGGWGPYTIAGN
ncbi:hypothetical protein ACFVTE_06675 [Arthrobacter sp. NPDC058097]|uniref:hypothetical protein n=1 Tax=Arthrobacter sp. NPDC058097 TaxID=3346340 RepID=UPI0036DBE0D2